MLFSLSILLPIPMCPRGTGFRLAAFDDYANVTGTAHGAFLVDAYTYPLEFELGEQNFSDLLGQGFDELELRAADEVDESLGHGLVIERIVDAVRGAGAADVRGHGGVEEAGLFGR